MRRLFGIPCLLALIAPWPASGEPPPHLELVRALRADGLGDLALEYLEKLRAHPPVDIADQLPLELARTRMELSVVELDPAKRLNLLEQARKGFEETIRKSAGHPEANAELARLRAYLARAQLIKARRVEGREEESTKAAKAAEAAKARPEIEEAHKQFQKAIKLIEEEIAKGKASAGGGRLRALQDTLSQVKMEEAKNLFSLVETYVKDDQESLLARAKALQRCRRAFSAIYEANENPDRYGWQALAWYAYLSTLMTEPQVAAKRFEEILARRGDPVAADGVRQARFFKVLNVFLGQDDGGKPPTGDYISNSAPLALGWLRDYPAQRNSPEGLQMRIIYAICEQKLPEILKLIARDANGKVTVLSGAGASYLQEAGRYFKDLTEFDNEFFDRAAKGRQEVLLTLADAEERGGEPAPSAVATFDRAVLQAQVQEARLSQFLRTFDDASEEGLKKQKAEERLRIGRAIAFLERGLALVTPKDSPREVFEAKFLLARCYLFGGQPMTAAVFAENLARQNPAQPKAAAVGSLALEAYNRMAGDALGTDDGKPLADVDIGHLTKFAAYMDATWPTSTATDEARQFWAAYTARAKKYAEAIDIFARIQPTYAGIDQARLQQGGALFNLIRGDTEASRLPEVVPERIKQYGRHWNATLQSLRDLKEPSLAASQYETQNYYNARLQLCQLLQLEGKNYGEIEAVAGASVKSLEESKSFGSGPSEKAELKTELLFALKAMRLSGVQGQAAKLLREGAVPAKVLEAIAAPLADIRREVEEAADGKRKEDIERWQKVPSYERYCRSQRDIVIIALRSSIQDGKLDEATALLTTLEKSGGSLESRLANLRSLSGTVRGQLNNLRRLGKADEEKKLVDGYAKFLDRMAAQPKLPPAVQIFLAQGYAAIDQDGRSVEIYDALLKSLPAPKETDAKDSDATKTYRQVQFNLARALRLAKQYDRAKEMLEKELIGGPWPNAKPDAPKGPFFNSIDARKERAYLYEDMGDFRSAVSYWVAQAKAFGEPLPPPNPDNDRDARKRVTYFDLFFESQRCSAKAYSRLDKAKSAAITAGFDRVAKQLYDMETKNPDLTTGLKDRVRELLEEYKPVKDKYKSLGGKLLDEN